MTILDAIADVFGAAFGGVYTPGALHYITSGEDAQGKATKTQETRGCLYQVEAVTDAMREAPGYSAEDIRLLILTRDEQGAPVPRPRHGDEFTGEGRRWALDMVSSDPAASHWVARATPLGPPTALPATPGDPYSYDPGDLTSGLT